MTSQNQEFGFVIPDLPDLPLDQLAELGDSGLAHSLALYRRRLEDKAYYSALSTHQLRFNGLRPRSKLTLITAPAQHPQTGTEASASCQGINSPRTGRYG